MIVYLFDPAADTASLAALHAASFPDPWDAAAITALLATPGTLAFHHADGFVLARIAGDEAEILTLAVMPVARGKGLGRALLQAAINQAQALGAVTMFLEVGVDNPAALALYSGLGFTRVGARKAYYTAAGGSGDALVLRLPLPAKFA
jgi:ribosomal-protein-alanine N-acetyltransferase